MDSEKPTLCELLELRNYHEGMQMDAQEARQASVTVAKQGGKQAFLGRNRSRGDHEVGG